MSRFLRDLSVGVLLTVMLLSGGCDSERREGLESFERAWFSALRQDRAEELYEYLDPRSKQRVIDELHALRAFDPPQQERVMSELGGVRAESFRQISPERYFAMWWRHKTNLQPADARFEVEAGARSGRVIVEVDGHEQDFAIRFESGRWMWFLPQDRALVPEG